MGCNEIVRFPCKEETFGDSWSLPFNLQHIDRSTDIGRSYYRLMILFAICSSLALIAGQNFLFGHLPNRQINFNTVDFAQPTQVRDPRQNRGPVVFPPSPPDAVDESSGVIVGASGYGFVPPQQTRRG